MNKLILIAIGFCLSVSSPIQAVELSTPTTNTSFSGKSASRKITKERTANNNDAVFGIIMGERSDDPCYLKVRFSDVNSGTETTSTYDECIGKEKSLKYVTLPNGTFATGVRVCLNNARDKVKGIQLLGTYTGCLQGDSTIAYLPSSCTSFTSSGWFGTGLFATEYQLCSTTEPSIQTKSCGTNATAVSNYIERTNCSGSNRGPDSDWETTRTCPSGTVATGLKLNVRDGGGNRDMISGIALRCSNID